MSNTDPRRTLERTLGADAFQGLSRRPEFVFAYDRMTVNTGFTVMGGDNLISKSAKMVLKNSLDDIWYQIKTHWEKKTRKVFQDRAEGSPSRFQAPGAESTHMIYALQVYNRFRPSDLVGRGSDLALGFGVLQHLPSKLTGDAEAGRSEASMTAIVKRSVADNLVWMQRRVNGLADMKGRSVSYGGDCVQYIPAREEIDHGGATIHYAIHLRGIVSTDIAPTTVYDHVATYNIVIRVPFATSDDYCEEDPNELWSITGINVHSVRESRASTRSTRKSSRSTIRRGSTLRESALKHAFGMSSSKEDSAFQDTLLCEPSIFRTIFPDDDNFSHAGLRTVTDDVARSTRDYYQSARRLA